MSPHTEVVGILSACLGSLPCGPSQRRKHSVGQAHLAPPPPSPQDKPHRWLQAQQAYSGGPCLREMGSPAGAEERPAGLCRGRPAGNGSPEKQEGRAQGSPHSQGWKRVWDVNGGSRRGVRFQKAELVSPHTSGLVPSPPPAVTFLMGPLTGWLGLEGLLCARIWVATTAP